MPHMSRPIVVVFPAHNEEPTVGAVVRRTPSEVADRPVEVVVVDDGSEDGTAAVARAAGATVHAHGANRGLGAAVRTGLAIGVDRGAAAIAFLDADGEYAPEELEHLIAPILSGRADYVAGSRFAGMPRRMLPHRWFGNRLLTVGVRAVVRRWGVRDLTDGQSGYRALSPAAAAAAEIVHDFNYAQVLTFDLLGKGFRYAEVPISYGFRRHGQSFVRLGPYLRRVLPAVWRELRSPSPAWSGSTVSILDDEALEAVTSGPPALGVETAVGS
jgi:glycosyltransferase involved in cell wall biosynthesis